MIGSTRNVTVWAYPKPCDYIRRVAMADIDNPHTVTLPSPIEEVMGKSES